MAPRAALVTADHGSDLGAPGRTRTYGTRFRKGSRVGRCGRHQATRPSPSPSAPAVAAVVRRGSSPNSSPTRPTDASRPRCRDLSRFTIVISERVYRSRCVGGSGKQIECVDVVRSDDREVRPVTGEDRSDAEAFGDGDDTCVDGGGLGGYHSPPSTAEYSPVAMIRELSLGEPRPRATRITAGSTIPMALGSRHPRSPRSADCGRPQNHVERAHTPYVELRTVVPITLVATY